MTVTLAENLTEETNLPARCL